MNVVLPIIGFWLICALVPALICMIGQLLFDWAHHGRVRFSLGTLLIFTTLLAVLLGLIAYTLRK